jgi:hypothetical protein
MFGVFQPRDRAIMNLVRAVGDAQGADARIKLLAKGEVTRHAGAAERLDGVVDDLQGQASARRP